MKRNFLNVIISITFLLSWMPGQAKAELDPKIKALSTVAGYGIVGGALLGVASLAFGTKARAIAIGASLGLYAGLLFGSYIVITHSMKNSRYNNPNEEFYPDDSFSPYEQGDGKTWLDGKLDLKEIELNQRQLLRIEMAQIKIDEEMKLAQFQMDENPYSFYLPIYQFQF